jgi:hypothetical protein
MRKPCKAQSLRQIIDDGPMADWRQSLVSPMTDKSRLAASYAETCDTTYLAMEHENETHLSCLRSHPPF